MDSGRVAKPEEGKVFERFSCTGFYYTQPPKFSKFRKQSSSDNISGSKQTIGKQTSITRRRERRSDLKPNSNVYLAETLPVLLIFRYLYYVV